MVPAIAKERCHLPQNLRRGDFDCFFRLQPSASFIATFNEICQSSYFGLVMDATLNHCQTVHRIPVNRMQFQGLPVGCNGFQQFTIGLVKPAFETPEATILRGRFRCILQDLCCRRKIAASESFLGMTSNKFQVVRESSQ